MEWVQVFSVVECKAEKEVGDDVVLDTEQPSFTILAHTCAFDIDQLSMIADDIVSGIMHGHNLNVLKYMRKNPFSNMNTEVQGTFFIFVEWAHSLLADVHYTTRFRLFKICFMPQTILFFTTFFTDTLIPFLT